MPHIGVEELTNVLRIVVFIFGADSLLEVGEAILARTTIRPTGGRQDRPQRVTAGALA